MAEHTGKVFSPEIFSWVTVISSLQEGFTISVNSSGAPECVDKSSWSTSRMISAYNRWKYGQDRYKTISMAAEKLEIAIDCLRKEFSFQCYILLSSAVSSFLSLSLTYKDDTKAEKAVSSNYSAFKKELETIAEQHSESISMGMTKIHKVSMCEDAIPVDMDLTIGQLDGMEYHRFQSRGSGPSVSDHSSDPPSTTQTEQSEHLVTVDPTPRHNLPQDPGPRPSSTDGTETTLQSRNNSDPKPHLSLSLHTRSRPSTPTETISTQATPTETTSTQVIPTETIPTQVIPTEATRTQATPTETTSTQVIPTEATTTQVTPTEITPTQVTPTETTPTEMTPTETIPTQVTTTETTPTQVTTTETTPTQVTPAETTLTQVTSGQVTPRSSGLSMVSGISDGESSQSEAGPGPVPWGGVVFSYTDRSKRRRRKKNQ